MSSDSCESPPPDAREALFEEETPQRPLVLRERGNAGVKGVLNDYEEARRHAEERLRARVEETKRMMYGETKAEEADPESAALDELERELFGEVVSESFTRARRPETLARLPKRRYGDVLELDEEEYIRTITELEEDVFAVIHIYETSVGDCTTINRLFERYAAEMPGVCFARITWEDSNRPFPESALPALLLYQGDILVKAVFGAEAFPFVRDILPGVVAPSEI